MRPLGGVLAFVLAMTTVHTAVAEPTPEEKESARTLLDEGDARIDAGDLEGALRAYEAADLVMNVPTTAIEVAKTRARLGRLLLARDAARRVEAFPFRSDEPAAFLAARTEARAILIDLGNRIAVVALTVTPPSATPDGIELDGVARPFVPTLELDPGPHRIVATASGVTVTHMVVLREGERQQVALALTPPAPPPQPDSSPRFVSSPVFWTGASIAVTSAIVATAFGAISASLTAEIEDACPGLDDCDPALQGDYDRANDFANVSNVAFGTMGAGVIVAVVGIIVAETAGAPVNVRGLQIVF